MKKIWYRLERDIIEYRFAVGALIVYYVLTRLLFHAFCPMVILTGLPCPGCGLNRAFWLLLSGQFYRSFSLHPMGIFWLLLILYFMFERYVAGRSMSKGFRVCLILVAAATLCLYGYRMATLFPDRPPMSYTGRNLMERLIPGYRETIFSVTRKP